MGDELVLRDFCVYLVSFIGISFLALLAIVSIRIVLSVMSHKSLRDLFISVLPGYPFIGLSTHVILFSLNIVVVVLANYFLDCVSYVRSYGKLAIFMGLACLLLCAWQYLFLQRHHQQTKKSP